MFDIGFNPGDIVKHDEICKKAKCGCMGGIRYSVEKNVVLLFIKPNSNYENTWSGDTFRFMGSGKGNQSATSSTNKRITDSSLNGTALCLFEWVDSIHLKYIGRMVLAGEPYYELRKSVVGDDERKVIFPLKKATADK